ncbi:MotA/TolQ/ExbB proton channel family protein [Nannocystaceae bacterium ST9]
MNLQESFLQLALLGANWVLWILVVLSIAAVAIVIERWLFFRGIADRDTALLKPLHDKLAGDDLEGAAKLVKGVGSPGARMVAMMIESADRGVEGVKAIFEGSRPSEKLRLERNLGFLGTVGANAPFIGLFGTVLEILRVFHLLGEQGVTTGDEARDIMSGISEALVATAIGLMVAIPAVIAYNAFQRRVKRTLAEAEGLAGMAIADLGAAQSKSKD